VSASWHGAGCCEGCCCCWPWSGCLRVVIVWLEECDGGGRALDCPCGRVVEGRELGFPCGRVVDGRRVVEDGRREVAARSCGRGRGRWSCRGRGRGRWSNDGGRERRAWSRARTVVEQSDVRGVVRGDRIGARCVGVRSCRGRGGGDGTERTGRVTRRQRGAVVEALEVESVRRGLHGCRLLQLPVSRSAEVR
jgi:hypothetical protein